MDDSQRKMDWWQRGWWAASKGQPQAPPAEPAMRDAYRIGYATGLDQRGARAGVAR